jgi:hypothetical protein
MVSRSSIRSTPHAREFLEKLKTACTGGQDGKDHDACAPHNGDSGCRGPGGHCCQCSRRQHGHDENTTQGKLGT